MESSSQFKIFAGSKGMALAKGICQELGCQLGALHVPPAITSWSYC